MTRRRGWNTLSSSYRNRIIRNLGQGDERVARRLYERGVSLKRARGHAVRNAAKPAPKPIRKTPRQRRIAELRQEENILRKLVAIRISHFRVNQPPGDTEMIYQQLRRYSDPDVQQIDSYSSGAAFKAFLKDEMDVSPDNFFYHSQDYYVAR